LTCPKNYSEQELQKAIIHNLKDFILEIGKDEVIKNFDKFKNIKNYPGKPKAFTEKGLYMLATILKPNNLYNKNVDLK
jgi:hypothetical protein